MRTTDGAQPIASFISFKSNIDLPNQVFAHHPQDRFCRMPFSRWVLSAIVQRKVRRERLLEISEMGMKRRHWNEQIRLLRRYRQVASDLVAAQHCVEQDHPARALSPRSWAAYGMQH
jgi:hypothetical protein